VHSFFPQPARTAALEVIIIIRALALLFLIHGEHTFGHSKAPEDVDAGHHDGGLAIKAPTMITDEIALVTLINGVCNAGVTDQTTK
jgi:hypothetical protein